MLVVYVIIIIIIASITLTIDIVIIGIGPSPCRSLGRYIIWTCIHWTSLRLQRYDYSLFFSKHSSQNVET